MMKLYSAPLSLFSRKVEIALAEKNLPYDRVLVSFTQDRGYFDKPPDVVRVNPKGQVPVLIDGDVELYDSTVIAEYLEDAYPEPRLFPQTPAARALARQWEMFADEVMLVPLRKLMHRTEPRDHSSDSWHRLEAEAKVGEAQLSSLLDSLDHALRNSQFLCGAFSVADISCFMQVFWCQRLAGPSFGGRRALREWFQRLQTRLPFKAVVAEVHDFDLRLSARVLNAYPDMPGFSSDVASDR
jgi:glutathione S-transferase